MMGRNRRTRVVFPVFNYYEVVVICANDVERTGKRLNADLSDARAGCVTHPGKPYKCWIVFGPEVDEALVAHEASHAVRAILAYVGARIDDEVFAHHLDFLVGRIHRFLKRGKP